MEALCESVQHLFPWIPWATSEAPSADRTRFLLSTWIAQRETGANFTYAVLRLAGGRLVGGVGLYDRVGPDRLEIGYWIRRTEAGQGLATEAAGAMTAAGFALPNISALELHTHVPNVLSRRVAEKLGYRFLGVRGHSEAESAVYECRSDQ
jgi:ribosomal-protein-serine acetyltransferase